MADGKTPATFEIEIGQTSAQSRVLVNGEDVSGSIQGVSISLMDLTKPPVVTLKVNGFKQRTKLTAVLGDVHVLDVSADEDANG